MSGQKKLVEASKKVLIENYGRIPFAMARGDGARIWDEDGNEYIDFFAGFGGAGVAGHCHPAIVEAVTKQASTIMCHGNLVTSRPQVELAERIISRAFPGKVFYCHSGTEANEAAIKLCRKAAGEDRYKLISFHNCFHGRTMGSLSITPETFQEGFGPMLPGGIMADYGDIESVRAMVDDQVAGIFVEPIQGEGGMNIPGVDFMKDLRNLCDAKNLILVCDEVWTAPARTGRWFAFQHYGIEPDVMTMAKAVGGGAPLGVCLVSEKYADVLAPGSHGCTMGGNPLCAAAGNAAMKLIEKEGLVQRAEELGRHVIRVLSSSGLQSVCEIRGKGLMMGMAFDESLPAGNVMKECMNRGLVVCIAKNNVLRLAPPLTIERSLLDRGLNILVEVLQDGDGNA